jgi:hypothetical protein
MNFQKLGCVAFPFIVGDLYYASNDDTCVEKPITNTKVTFDMAVWLRVHAFVALSLAIVLVSAALAIWRLGGQYAHLFFVYLLTLVLTAAFRVAWAIMGALMFWGFLYPKMCAEGVSRYLSATLIVSILLVFANCLATRQKSDMEMQPISQHEAPWL